MYRMFANMPQRTLRTDGVVLKGLVVFVGFLGLAALETWPLLAHFGGALGGGGSDALLNTWILSWDVHALATRPLRLFDANFLYPIERSLALSDHLLGVVAFFAPAYALTGNAVAGYNTLVLASFALSGFGAFALAWYWTRRWGPSIVAGLLFGFSPVRFGQIGHLQLLNFFWAPGALIFLDRFLRRRRWRDLAGFAVLYWLQVLASLYLAFMLTVAVVVYAGAYVCAIDRRLLDRAMALRAAVFAAASLAVLLPFELAYLQVQRAWEASWTLGAMAPYSADVQSYLSAPPLVNDLYAAIFRPVSPAGAHERLLFPGLVLMALVVIGCCARVRGIPEPEARRARRVFGLVAVIAFVLSLGPYLVVFGVNTRVPMPYTLLYYVVPGWSAMRVPARFAFVVLLACVPLAALGALALAERAAALARGRAGRRVAAAFVAFALGGLFLLELGAKPLPLQPTPTGREIPEVYRWLARERPGPLVELPVAVPRYEHQYLYLSTVHWLPIVNGRSGFAPSSHDDIKAILAELPGTRAREYAAALGLAAIVVHGDTLPVDEHARWAAAEIAGHVRRLATFGADVVYAVPPVAPAATLRAQLAAPGALPAGADVRLGLRLSPVGRGPWAHGRPHRIDHAIVRWTDAASGRTITATVPVTLPLVVGAGESAAIALRVSAPSRPGRYALDVTLARHGLVAGTQIVEVGDSRTLPTSAEAREPLAAEYTLDDDAGPRAVTPADSLRVTLTARNTGRAVWLVKARGKQGDVWLRWRWVTADNRPLALEGGTPIRYDVLPGARYAFDAWVTPPVVPGRYGLELGLVSGGGGPLGAGGVPPVRLVVDVASRSR
jgi:hypothetical protein